MSDAQDFPDVPNEAEIQSDGKLRQALSSVVGALRAENLGEDIFRYFAEPDFLPELQGVGTCMLRGGRGTGKTTVLRSLSYQGQAATSALPFESWAHVGFFMRINTNRVGAFKGDELSLERWSKLFGHYLNLELCDLVLQFVLWLENRTPAFRFSAEDSLALCESLNLAESRTAGECADALDAARRKFGARINNIADGDSGLQLSLLGAPLDDLVAHLRTYPELRDKKVFFLIDEYENLLDYQQAVLNTLIKHAGEFYCFKIGVKTMGLRNRATLNPHQTLSEPADYQVINITERLAPRFEHFATSVLSSRLMAVLPTQTGANLNVRDLFPAIAPDDEAVELGVEEACARRLREVSHPAPPKQLSQLSPLARYFVLLLDPNEWDVAARGLASRDAAWVRKYGNYSRSILYAVRGPTPGRRRIYAGWDTLCALSGANVRYLLQLASGVLQAHVAEGHSLSAPVPLTLQSSEIQAVARRNLQDLERDSDRAAQLIRLCLSLGRVFGVLAASPVGHAPEITQFHVQLGTDDAPNAGARAERVKLLLDEAVNAQAFVRFPGSKLQEPSDTRAYDYALHPMFAALFDFSWRRKRKLTLSEEEFLALVADPRWAINRILTRHNRSGAGSSVPDQLKLFTAFYDS